MTPTTAVAEQVRRARKGKGWSGERLGEELAKVGIPWNRNVVANFESGRRKYVTMDEVFALSQVLDIAPVHLLVPIAAEHGEMALFPGVFAEQQLVRDWIRGIRPLPGQDPRRYFSATPEHEYREAFMARQLDK